MNERLKELAVQAGLALTPNTNPISWFGLAIDLERFAELVRDDEREKCASDYLQDCCDAIDAARLEEREACALLCEEWYLAGAAANAIRERSEPNPAFKNYMGDNWAGIV